MIGWPLRILALSALAATGVGGYFYFTSDEAEPPRLDPVPERVYSRVVDQVAEGIRIPPGSARLLLAPVPGDRGDLRLRLRDKLRRKSSLDVVPLEETEEEETLRSTLTALFDRWVGTVVGAPEPEESKKGTDLLVVAELVELIDAEDRYRLEVRWKEGEIRKKGKVETIETGSASDEIRRSWTDLDYAQISIGQSSRPLRVGMWLAIVLLPPLAFIGPIRKVLEKESNLKNLYMVLALAIPGTIAGWVFSAFGEGWTGGGIALLAAFLSVAYSFAFCTVIEEARG